MNEIDRELAQRVVDIVHAITRGKVNIMGAGGVIIASAEPERVGSVHEGAARIMAGEALELAVTPEMAASMQGALPGYNGAVRFRGRVIGCIGLGGDPELMRPLQQMAAQIVVDALQQSEQELKEEELRREAVANINDIAETMKVLALNGSIQAAKLGARAGGFKVVAQEMKHLAESINDITHHFQR